MLIQCLFSSPDVLPGILTRSLWYSEVDLARWCCFLKKFEPLIACVSRIWILPVCECDSIDVFTPSYLYIASKLPLSDVTGGSLSDNMQLLTHHPHRSSYPR